MKRSPVAGEMLDAWLLLMVGKGHGYGYAIVAEGKRQGILVEPTLVYRKLRRFDEEGLVRSEWGTPVDGPRRRVYAITQSGISAREELVAHQRATCRAFLSASRKGGR